MRYLDPDRLMSGLWRGRRLRVGVPVDDSQPALSFSGKWLPPDDVVKVVAKVIDKPRPVTTVPAWRGGQVRSSTPNRAS